MNETEDKPPSNQINMGVISRFLPSVSSMARRFKSQWQLLGDSRVPCVRSFVRGRCPIIYTGIQE
mgnify:CR=1 FL=1